MTNCLLWGFSKEIKSIIIIVNFYRLIYFLKFCLYRVFHWYSSVYWTLSSLLVIKIIKIVTWYNSWLSTILYFLNLKDQLNSKNLWMKLCMHPPVFHPQYFLKLIVEYNPVDILGSYICNLVVQFLISDVRFILE